MLPRLVSSANNSDVLKLLISLTMYPSLKPDRHPAIVVAERDTALRHHSSCIPYVVFRHIHRGKPHRARHSRLTIQSLISVGLFARSMHKDSKTTRDHRLPHA